MRKLTKKFFQNFTDREKGKEQAQIDSGLNCFSLSRICLVEQI